ncbi:MAG: hypothetical protein WCC11_02830 [Gammaproteobacteria bacterium]
MLPYDFLQSRLAHFLHQQFEMLTRAIQLLVGRAAKPVSAFIEVYSPTRAAQATHAQHIFGMDVPPQCRLRETSRRQLLRICIVGDAVQVAQYPQCGAMTKFGGAQQVIDCHGIIALNDNTAEKQTRQIEMGLLEIAFRRGAEQFFGLSWVARCADPVQVDDTQQILGIRNMLVSRLPQPIEGLSDLAPGKIHGTQAILCLRLSNPGGL